MKEIVFGMKYLLERKPREFKEAVERPLPREGERPRNPGEIVAAITPFDKAILWTIGTGNYLASEIYEEVNKKLKE